MKNLIITRGVSGSGKTSFGNFLWDLDEDVVVCCADDYFTNNGVYEFDVTLLSEAHLYCRQKAERVMHDYTKTVVIANTNCNEKDMQFYEECADRFGYRIFHIVLENRHGGENIHGVPDFILENQENKLRDSLKLR